MKADRFGLALVIIIFVILTMPNGSKIELWFNETGIADQKSCIMPPRNPNSNITMGDVGCP